MGRRELVMEWSMVAITTVPSDEYEAAVFAVGVVCVSVSGGAKSADGGFSCRPHA